MSDVDGVDVAESVLRVVGGACGALYALLTVAPYVDGHPLTVKVLVFIGAMSIGWSVGAFAALIIFLIFLLLFIGGLAVAGEVVGG